MAETTKTTRDHDEIRNWAEERGGKPAHVSGTGSNDDIGILRIEFSGAPGSSDANLEAITWEQFFEKFEERGLALLYQAETAEGGQSNFNKLVSGSTAADAGEHGGKAPATKKARKASSAKSTATARRSAPAAKKAPVKKKAAAKKAAASRKAVRKAGKKKLVLPKGGSSSKRSGTQAKKAAKKAAARKQVTKKATKKATKKTARKAGARKKR